MSTLTPRLHLNKPDILGDEDVWGQLVNANFDTLDAAFTEMPAGFLPLEGGTMTGALTLAGNAALPLQAAPVQQVNILWGYGLSLSQAALSSRYATLADAQVDYPFASSLDQTMDWAAIQKALLNPNSPNGTAIVLPPGDIAINSPLVSNGHSVFIQGHGPYTTRLIWTGGGDLFQHGLTALPPLCTFMVRDVGLYIGVAGTPGYAINIRQDMNSGGFMLDNVVFGNFGPFQHWKGYVLAEGTTRTVVRDVFASGGEFDTPERWALGVQHGFTFYSPNNSNKSFVFYFDNCNVSAIRNAIYVNIAGPPGNSGSIEGMTFHNCTGRTCTDHWLRSDMPASAGAWNPPYYIFDKCNMQAATGIISATGGIAELHVQDCLFYFEPPVSGGGQTAMNSIEVSVNGAYIRNNSFITFAGAEILSFINIAAGSHNAAIEGNTFLISDPSVTLTAGITNAASNVNVFAWDNNFTNWPGGTPTTTNIAARPIDSTVIGGTTPAAGTFTGLTTPSVEAPGTSTLYLGNSARLGLLALADPGGPVANLFQLQASTAGFGPSIQVIGSDADAPLNLYAKGSAHIALMSNVQCSGSIQIGGAGAAWSTGTGAPSANFPIGSLYSRTDGAIGSTLYVSRGGGTWGAVPGSLDG